MRVNSGAWSAPMAFQYMTAMGTMSECGQNSTEFTCNFQLDAIEDARGAMNYIVLDAGSHFVQYWCKDMVGDAMYMDFVWIAGRNPELANDAPALAAIHD